MARKEKLIEKAQKCIQKGNLDKAISEYKAAFDLDPKDISIRLRLGDLYIKTHRKEEAIKEYAEAAKANTQRGFYLKAIAVYKQVLKLDDSILDIHYRLAELYTKQRLNADAIGEYSYIVNTFEKLGKHDDAIDLIKKMVTIDPENIGARLRLAEMYQKRKFDKDARAEYSAVFDRLMAEGKLDRAEKIYTSLRKSYPGNAGVLENLRRLYREKADTAGFVDCSRELLDQAVEAGDSGRVTELCSEILELSPGDEAASKAMEKFARGRVDDAAAEEAEAPSPVQEAVEEAVETYPDAVEEAPAGEAPVEVSSGEAALPDDSGEDAEELEEIEVSFEGFDDSVEEAAPEEADVEAAAEPSVEAPEVEAMVEIDVPGLDEEELEAAPAEPVAEPAEEAVEETVVEAAPDAEPVEPAPEAAEHMGEATGAESAAEQAEEEAVAEEDIGEAPSDLQSAFADALRAVEEASTRAAGEEDAGDDEYFEEEIDIEIEEPVDEEAPDLEAVSESDEEPVEAAIEPEVAEEAVSEPDEEPVEAAIEPEVAEEAVSEPDEEPVEAAIKPEVAEEAVLAEADEAAEAAAGESVVEESLPEAAGTAPDIEVMAEDIDEASHGFDEEPVEAAVEPEVAEEAVLAEADAGESVAEESLPDAAEEAEPIESVEPAYEEPEPVESLTERVERFLDSVPEPETAEAVASEGGQDLEAASEPEAVAAGEPEADMGEDVEEDLAEAVSDLMEKIEPEEHLLEKYHGSVASELDSSAEGAESGEDYVDLTTELGMEEALESLAGSWGGDGDPESLDEFRNGIGKQLSREDTETHYNLGIAYMEMELYNEAANEFKIALKDPALEFECYTRLGLCSMEAGAHEDAIMYYEKGMQVRARSEDERKGIMYELALACEAADDAPRAAELFAEIYAADPAYREVAEKMARYEASRPLLPLDDGMIEVELL